MLASKDQIKTSDVSLRYKSVLERLNNHPLYSGLDNKNNIKIFMEHHVYAVWDFMSIIKSLQTHVAPNNFPWIPPKNSRNANFINQLVLEEESDEALTDSAGLSHASHFESYLLAMIEVGANTKPITQFISKVENQGLESALQLHNIPAPAKRFMTFTFDVIERNQPHLLAALLAYGRETLVPKLFQSIQDGFHSSLEDTPNLHAYLERHIQLDKHEHGPLAVLLMQELCEGSIEKQNDAIHLAEQAVTTRLEFWDGIYDALSV